MQPPVSCTLPAALANAISQEMAQHEQTFDLPAPQRAGWGFMVLVSLGVSAFGGFLLFSQRQALATESLAGAFGLLGTGCFLSCFGALMLFSRKPAARLVVDAKARVLRLVDGSGASADMPAESLLRALAARNPSDGSGHVLALHKRDGGVLELCTVSVEQDALALGAEITSAISQLHQTRPEAATWDAAAQPGRPPRDTLPTIAGVRAERRGDALELRWSAGAPLRTLIAVGCPLGLGLVGMAGVREGGGFGLSLFVGMCFTVALVILFSVVAGRGVAVLVTVAASEVRVEKLRFGFPAGTQRLPLAAIKAVDYAHQLNSENAGLSLRTTQLDEPLEQLAEVDNAKDAFSAALKLMQGIGSGISIPCGDLSLASKVALDMLLSEEVARRSARMPEAL